MNAADVLRGLFAAARSRRVELWESTGARAGLCASFVVALTMSLAGDSNAGEVIAVLWLPVLAGSLARRIAERKIPEVD